MPKTLPIPGDVRPPFEVPAPDGEVYFDILRPVRRVAATFEEMSLTEAAIAKAASRSKDPATKADMAVLLREMREVRRYMERELSTIAVETAAFGTKKIKDNIHKTNVRPLRTDDLHDSVVCRPINTGIPTAAVGIASIGALDRGTKRPGMKGGYWASQEFGFVLTARIVPGYFMPGYSRPSPANFRQHPNFEQMQYAKGMPALNIVNDMNIAPRNFIRGSLDEIWQFRHQRVERLKKIVMASLNSVSAGTRANTALGAAMRRYRPIP
jgi:hypothetical protein